MTVCFAVISQTQCISREMEKNNTVKTFYILREHAMIGMTEINAGHSLIFLGGRHWPAGRTLKEGSSIFIYP